MRSGRYRWLPGLLLPALVTLAATTLVAAPAQAAPPCSVRYEANGWITTPGPDGFVAKFTLTNNTTTTTKGWRVEVHYEVGVHVTQYWNSAKLLDAGSVYVFGDIPKNAAIAPGASTNFGLQAEKTPDSLSNTPYSIVCSPQF